MTRIDTDGEGPGTDRRRDARRSGSAIATTGRRSALPCARATAALSPASISTPISARGGLRRGDRHRPLDHRDRRQRHRDHRRGAPSAPGMSRADHGGVALRLVPRADPRLRREGAGDRAERPDAVGRVDRRIAAEQISAGHRVNDARPHRHARTPRGRCRRHRRCARRSWGEFVGQEKARNNLSIFIEAARKREGGARPCAVRRSARASARPRWRRSWRANSASVFARPRGPVIAKAGDLAALLTNLEERDVLFIDEIHRLNPAVEEVLYPAMEDFQLDLIIGEGPRRAR